MPGIIRRSLSVLLIVLSILGLLNVYSDNSEVIRMASRVACAACDPHLIQSGRSPIAQTLTFQTAPATLVIVECKREFIFLGDYGCALTQ